MPKNLSLLLTTTLMSLTGSGCRCLGAEMTRIDLLSSGVSPYSIVCSAAATETEKTAASELAEHLRLSFGIDIPLMHEAPETGPAIYVGQTAFAKAHGISFSTYGAEEWLIQSVGADLVLGGGRPRGTLYAVYEFLENDVGILWMDENYTYVPHHTTLSLTAPLLRTGKPAFSLRGIFVFPREEEKRLRLMIRNRENMFHDQYKHVKNPEKWGVFPVYGGPRACHSFYYYTKDWPADCMDCFSMNSNGKRLRATGPLGPGQVCFSNVLARELFIAKLKEYIQADRKAYPEYYPAIYDLSQNDTPDKCVCPDCLALAEKYGAYSGAQLEFINAVADGIADDYPDVHVMTFAYMFTEDAPKGIVPRPNVMIRIAQLDDQFKDGIRDILRPLASPHNAKLLTRLQEWGAIGKISLWDYWTLYSGDNEATLNINTVSANLRLYKESNANALFAEFQKPDACSFYPLRLWLGYQLLQDPDQDVDLLTDRFMRAYYGAAAPFMKELAGYIERRMNELTDIISRYALAARPDLDHAFFDTTERLLVSAEEAVEGDRDLLIRIARERIPLDLARLKLREAVAEHLPPGRDVVAKRLQQNWPEWVKNFYPEWLQEKHLERVDSETRRLSTTASAPLPEEFRGRDVIDILWTSFEPVPDSGAHVVDVPDAAAGKAIQLATPRSRGGSSYNNHQGGLLMGVYGDTSRRELARKHITPGQLPQDERFHLYSLGRVTLEQKCKVWVHKSWLIQHKLGEFYGSGGLPNDYELYVSLKLEGPSYVQGSTKTDAVSMDRILLVRPGEAIEQ